MNVNSGPASDLFGAYYYAHNCGQPYSRAEGWINFFDQIAAHLIMDFAPSTVLDAGCAWGLLVERLRARGVEAYGIDISEYAIQNVHPDIQQYCWVGSITDPFPRRYDLIISIEVLEHMLPHDSELAVANLCTYSDNIIFSSTPFNYQEATHLNVQPPDYWARLFARHQFFHDLDYDATTYLTPWAFRFYRALNSSAQSVVQAYERKLFQLQSEIKDLRASVVDYHQKLEASAQLIMNAENIRFELENLQSKLQQSELQIAEVKKKADLDINEKIEKMQQELQEWQWRWNDLQQGRGWRMLQAIQGVRVRLFPVGSRRERIMYSLFPRKTRSGNK